MGWSEKSWVSWEGKQGRFVRGVLADSLVRLNFESKNVSCLLWFLFFVTCTRSGLLNTEIETSQINYFPNFLFLQLLKSTANTFNEINIGLYSNNNYTSILI